MYKNTRQKCIKRMKNCTKAHEKSPNGIKSILRALSQFGSRSITMRHFLQKLLSCNKLCAIIVVGRHHKLCLLSLVFRLPCLLWHAVHGNVRCLWSPYVKGQTIIFLPCDFYLLSSFFFLFFFPRLISAAADWMSAILPHMVWP